MADNQTSLSKKNAQKLNKPQNNNHAEDYNQLSVSYSTISKATNSLKYNVNMPIASMESIPYHSQQQIEDHITESKKHIVGSKMVEDLLQNHNQQIISLRIQLDTYKLLGSVNSQAYAIPASLLQQKAKLQSQIYLNICHLQKDSESKKQQMKELDEYEAFLGKQLQQINDDDTILHLDQEAEVLKNNLQLEIKYQKRALQQIQARNLQQINSLKKKIKKLRVEINNKEESLIKIKKQICQYYMHHNKKTQKIQVVKNRQLSTPKKDPIIKNLEMTYAGNKIVEEYTQQITDSITQGQQLVALRFQTDKKQNLIFQGIYKRFEGKIHFLEKSKDFQFQKPKQISLIDLLSMKIFFKHKIVGIGFECRSNNLNGKKNITIGNCLPNTDNVFVNLVQKKIMRISSFWYKNQMVGLGIWHKDTRQNSKSSQKIIVASRSNKQLRNYQ